MGTRQTDDDYCLTNTIIIKKHKTLLTNTTEFQYCQNNGYCYSTNTGPKCDCKFTDFDGRQCNTSKKLKLNLEKKKIFLINLRKNDTRSIIFWKRMAWI